MKNRLIHIVYTTLIFLAAWVGYSFLFNMGAAAYVLPNDEIRWGSHIRGLALIIGGSIGLALLAEWIGYAISKWLGEAPEKAKQFSFMWVRGIVLYFAIVSVCAIGILQAGRTGRPIAPFLAGAGMMVVLYFLQKPISWVITGKRYRGPKIPGRMIGGILALLWNLMGMYLVQMFHEQTSFFSAAGLVLIGFGMVFPIAVGYVLFASVERALSRTANPIAHWNTSGMILYFSWFCFGFIARLTPTTLGRPEKWMGLPKVKVTSNPESRE